MKKKIHKAKSKSFSILNVIAKVLFYMALCVVIYALIIIPILTSVLKHHGIRCEAIITSGESAPFYTRYSTNDYLYEFTDAGTDNSLSINDLLALREKFETFSNSLIIK